MNKVITLLFLFFIPLFSFGQLSDDELLQAIRDDDIAKITRFYKNGQNNPDKVIGPNKIPPIHYAAGLNRPKMIEILIKAGANFNVLYYNDSPIMTAIYYNHYKVVELLLKSGVDINFKDPDGRTAAIKAVKYNKLELLELLINNKADLSIKDNKAKSAIDYAYELQHIELYEHLSEIVENKYKNLNLPDYFDGPYVFWESRSRLKATYLIHDKKKNKTIRVDSIITFKKDNTVIKRAGQAFEIPLRRIKKGSAVQFEFTNVEKIMAIGDLHGEFDTFVDFLTKNKIIDSNYNWTFGKGHLVLAGDIFDRGPKVNECFWLLYKLEIEAKEHGGYVHFVLGNHEIMEISGDKRYLSDKYRDLFNKLGLNYTYFYGDNTEIGKWLRTKNSVIKINNTIFVHGGLSPELVNNKLDLETINNSIRDIINRKNSIAITQTEDFMLSNLGPLWYRGYIKLDDNYYKNTGAKYNINQNEVDRIIKFYSAEAIVFANTHVKEIKPFFNFKLFGIDIPFAESEAQLQGLYIENGHYYKTLINGTKKIIH